MVVSLYSTDNLFCIEIRDAIEILRLSEKFEKEGQAAFSFKGKVVDTPGTLLN